MNVVHAPSSLNTKAGSSTVFSSAPKLPPHSPAVDGSNRSGEVGILGDAAQKAGARNSQARQARNKVGARTGVRARVEVGPELQGTSPSPKRVKRSPRGGSPTTSAVSREEVSPARGDNTPKGPTIASTPTTLSRKELDSEAPVGKQPAGGAKERGVDPTPSELIAWWEAIRKAADNATWPGTGKVPALSGEAAQALDRELASYGWLLQYKPGFKHFARYVLMPSTFGKVAPELEFLAERLREKRATRGEASTNGTPRKSTKSPKLPLLLTHRAAQTPPQLALATATVDDLCPPPVGDGASDADLSVRTREVQMWPGGNANSLWDGVCAWLLSEDAVDVELRLPTEGRNNRQQTTVCAALAEELKNRGLECTVDDQRCVHLVHLALADPGKGWPESLKHLAKLFVERGPPTEAGRKTTAVQKKAAPKTPKPVTSSRQVSEDQSLGGTTTVRHFI